MDEYTYIIAPKSPNNLNILLGFVGLYPTLAEQSRLKTFTKRDVNDVISPDGQLLIAAGAEYYMVKATTSDFNPDMLDNVTDPETYTVANLPDTVYWL